MNKEIKEGIVVGLIVVFVLIVAYLTTSVFLTGEIGNAKEQNDNEKDESVTKSEETSSLYDNMIIASKTFSQNKDKYMVIFFSNNNDDDLKNAISTYDSSEKDVILYKVNLDEAINKYVISEKENNNPIGYQDLKIKDSALITIENGNVSSYITEESKIIEKLN